VGECDNIIPVQGYIIRRLLISIVVMMFVGLFTFGLLYITPGDPASIIGGQDATPEDLERIREKLGLNDPFHTRLGKWLGTVVQGDLGESIFSNHKVSSLIWARAQPTISLALLSLMIAVGFGVPMGILAAWKSHTYIDRAVMTFASLGIALPSFALGFLVMWVFGVKFRIFPVAGFVPITEGFGDYMKHLAMPAFTVGLSFMALITRMTRASMLEVLQEDYIRTARAKGLRHHSVLFRHALKNAMLPVLTIIGLGLASLVAGLVVVETVFGVSGLGRLVGDSISRRDYPVIQGVILTVSFIYIFVNLLVDVLYGYLDPRIRY
jgi:peptide/nickel transport system permease protein